MKIQHLIINFAFIAMSYSLHAATVAECTNRPEFVNRSGPTFALKSLPPMVLIGSEANYYVENKISGLKIWGSQSFKNGKSKINCATSGKAASEGFSMYGPTLIDLTEERKTGDSFWQFHLAATPAQFGIWNQNSRLFSKSKDLETALAKTGAHIQIFQRTHDTFEIILTKESDQSLEILLIRLDAVSKLK